MNIAKLPSAPRQIWKDIARLPNAKVSLYQRRLRPGPRKVKQTLSFVVGLGVGGRQDCLFGILPELVCLRHGTLTGAPTRPDLRLPAQAVPICSKLHTSIAASDAYTRNYFEDRSKLRTNRIVFVSLFISRL
jgi:hypothetical protein